MFRPELCGNSFLRYPRLRTFFHSGLVTRNLRASKVRPSSSSCGFHGREGLKPPPSINPPHMGSDRGTTTQKAKASLLSVANEVVDQPAQVTERMRMLSGK